MRFRLQPSRGMHYIKWKCNTANAAVGGCSIDTCNCLHTAFLHGSVNTSEAYVPAHLHKSSVILLLVLLKVNNSIPQYASLEGCYLRKHGRHVRPVYRLKCTVYEQLLQVEYCVHSVSYANFFRTLLLFSTITQNKR